MDILHRVGIRSSPQETFEALRTREGLAGCLKGEKMLLGPPHLRYRTGPGTFLARRLEEFRATNVRNHIS